MLGAETQAKAKSSTFYRAPGTCASLHGKGRAQRWYLTGIFRRCTFGEYRVPERRRNPNRVRVKGHPTKYVAICKGRGRQSSTLVSLFQNMCSRYILYIQRVHVRGICSALQARGRARVSTGQAFRSSARVSYRVPKEDSGQVEYIELSSVIFRVSLTLSFVSSNMFCRR